jgi:hypothetical protein
MQKIRFIFLFLGVVALPALAIAQSGWTRAQGSFFGKLDFSRMAAKSYYTPTGNKLTTNAFHQNSFNFYGEYGLKKRWTIIAAAPLFRTNAFETTEPVSGMGDLRLELKYRLTKDTKIPVALSIAPELPTGRRNATSKSKTVPGEQINLPTGDGEFNIWSTLAASKSFGKLYASAFAAYNFRTEYKGLAFRDQYQFGIEGGWNPVRKLWVNAKLRAQFATGENIHPELGFVRGDGTTYTLLSTEAFYKITKNWGLSAAYLTGGDWIAPLKNIYVAPFFSIGVVYEK